MLINVCDVPTEKVRIKTRKKRTVLYLFDYQFKEISIT